MLQNEMVLLGRVSVGARAPLCLPKRVEGEAWNDMGSGPSREDGQSHAPPRPPLVSQVCEPVEGDASKPPVCHEGELADTWVTQAQFFAGLALAQV